MVSIPKNVDFLAVGKPDTFSPLRQASALRHNVPLRGLHQRTVIVDD